MHTPQKNIRNRMDDFLDRGNALVRGEKRLTRSTGSLTGVCEGLGQYFGVNPVYFRVGFAVGTLFSGIGVLAYGALALILPKEDQASFRSSGPRRQPRSRRIEQPAMREETEILDHRICLNCDTVGKANARFCHACGAPL
ncbi:MAG: PspC domain-containing protein [Bacteroidota bacterium]